MAVEAVAHATGKIIHTALDKTAAYALNLDAKVSAEIQGDKSGVHGKVPSHVKKTATKTLKAFGCERYGLTVALESRIPQNSGLGEAEAACLATALATTAALAKRHGAVNELKIDKFMREQYMIVEGNLVDKKKLLGLCAGEYDRLFCSLYGGFAVCDNRKLEILRRGEMETLQAVVATPKKKQKLQKDRLTAYRHEADLIWDEALKGNLYGAMRLSTLLYADPLAPRMLAAGSFAANTTYPSCVAFARDAESAKKIAGSVRKEASVTVTQTANTQSCAMVKPVRIVKAKEFLEMRAGQEYFFL